MLLKPFNEHLLWKGKLQRYNAKSKLVQPPMDLPIVNSLTGYYDPPRRPTLSEEREYQYSLYSAAYWAGVKERQRLYRSIQPSEPLPLFYS